MVDFPLVSNGFSTEALTQAQRDLAQVTPPLDEAIVDRLTKKNSKQRLSTRTRERYKEIVRDFNRFLEKNGLSISQESLTQYFDALVSQHRPATVNLHKSALLKCVKAQMGSNNVLLNIAIEKVFEMISVYKPDKSVSEAQCITENQVKAMVDGAPSEKTALIIRFLYKTGCRVSEMTNVRLNDCEPMNGYMRIRIVGKGNKERKTTIPVELFREIRQVYGGKTWLLESRSGRPLHRVNVGAQVKRAAERIGLLDFYPHLLRHSRATDLLINKEISLKAVSKFLGHTSVAITAEMYIHDEVDYHELFSKDLI